MWVAVAWYVSKEFKKLCKQLKSCLFVISSISVGCKICETENLPVTTLSSSHIWSGEQSPDWKHFWREWIWVEPKRRWKLTFLLSPSTFLMSSTLFLKHRSSPWEGSCRPWDLKFYLFPPKVIGVLLLLSAQWIRISRKLIPSDTEHCSGELSGNWAVVWRMELMIS